MAGEFKMTFSGAKEAMARLEELVVKARAASRTGVMAAAHLLEAKAKGNAPVVTGTLRRSIYTSGPTIGAGTAVTARVGPTVAYGRRVELGFRGTDSAGRHYSQPGRPYFQPAYIEVLPEIGKLMREAWSHMV